MTVTPDQIIASSYVSEYGVRQSLAKLGYTTGFDTLDEVTGRAFLEIADVIADARERELKKGR